MLNYTLEILTITEGAAFKHLLLYANHTEATRAWEKTRAAIHGEIGPALKIDDDCGNFCIRSKDIIAARILNLDTFTALEIEAERRRVRVRTEANRD